MKWNFRLKNLLKVRTQVTNQAMAAYAAAQADLSGGLKELQDLYDQVDENFKGTQRTREEGGFSSGSLKTHDEFFAGQQVKIERQKQKVRQLKEIVEEKHSVLVEKMVEQKSIEKLEEKEYKLFLKAVKKKEQGELDDLVVMRAKGRM